MHMTVKMVSSFQTNISHHSFGYPQSSKTCGAGLLWLETFASIYMVLDTPSALDQQTVVRRSGADKVERTVTVKQGRIRIRIFIVHKEANFDLWDQSIHVVSPS